MPGGLYLATSRYPSYGKVVTTLATYSTGRRQHAARLGSARATAYLINPATRTHTTLQLHGVPRILDTVPAKVIGVELAW
jgi:hypothetical protein